VITLIPAADLPKSRWVLPATMVLSHTRPSVVRPPASGRARAAAAPARRGTWSQYPWSMRTVGLLHPGEMGASIGAAVRRAGVEVLWVSAGRRPATRRRAQAADLTDAGALPALVARSGLVLSVCPPQAAIQVAGAVAALGFGGIYVDANAVAPTTARALGVIVERAGGGRFVDGDLIGGPVRPGGACGCRLFGHIMRPAHTHGSAHRVDRVGRRLQPAGQQVVRQGRAGCLPQGAVRTVAVVVIGILGQHGPQLPAPQDQHPIEHFPPNGANPPLRPSSWQKMR
jgi:hypothetical protein